MQRFSAAYDNLRSTNPEDWSNAVHSCRRILEDLADSVFPPQQEPRIKVVNGREIKIQLKKQNYINRIVAFVEDNSESGRFVAIVGSHLRFLGDRLDAAFGAAQKGTHQTIVSREEADRYVLFTYMLVGDIIALIEGRPGTGPRDVGVEINAAAEQAPDG